MRRSIITRRTLIAAVMLALVAGCEDQRFDHEPPPGLGSLVVDNLTGTSLEVFIDRAAPEQVRAWRHRIWDMTPGIHRLVIRDGDDGRFYSGDADIVEGRLTIAEVRIPPDRSSLEIIWRMD